MDITVSLQIKIQFDGNKNVSVGNVATAVKGLGLEQKMTEAAIQKVDEELIEKYCGGMYARGNGNQRAGTVKRHPKTSVGKLDLKLHRVKDKEEGETRIFLPVDKRLPFCMHDKPPVVIGDAEREMRNALVKGERSFQLDFVHVFRDTGFKLWQDGKMALDDRKEVIRRLKSALYSLKNSVEKHEKDGDFDALKRYSNTIVTSAVLAVKGRKVPWNSNLIERLMGEIAKRTKHKWMRWTTKGLETILDLILIRYVSEESYEVFKSRMMKSDNLRFIKGEVKSISAGGEF